MHGYDKVLFIMEIIHTLVYQPIFNLLFLLYKIGGENLGIAIVLLAIIVKILMIPVMNSQKKMAIKQKEIAGQLNELKVKYKDDPQTLLKEQMKLQGGMGAGLGGCVMLIVTILLFLQIRTAILDLTNQGWHAFNNVAYVDSWKQPVDSLSFQMPTLSSGSHIINIDIKNGEFIYSKEVEFWIYSNDEEKKKYQKESNDKFGKNTSSAGQHNGSNGVIKLVSMSGNHLISMYSPQLRDSYVVSSEQKLFETYFRYPSNAYNKELEFKVDGNALNTFVLTKGSSINLNFLGIDLGKTAMDVAPDSNVISNLLHPAVIPYLILALALGLAQFFSFKYLTPSKSTDIQEAKNIIEGEVINETAELEMTKDQKKKELLSEDIKNKLQNEEGQAVDMAKTMEDMSSSMSWMFAALSVITSLGLLGGAQFFPAGLSIYWTSQSLFDIMKVIYGGKLSEYIKTFRVKADFDKK